MVLEGMGGVGPAGCGIVIILRSHAVGVLAFSLPKLPRLDVLQWIVGDAVSE